MADTNAGHYVAQVRACWARFTASCSWVPVESSALVAGSGSYLQENIEDASWLERIAGAFEQAGSGRLSNSVIAAAVSAELSPELQTLLNPGISPAEAAKAWAALALTKADIQALPLESQLILANLDGIPFAARDTASRALLKKALTDSAAVYQIMGYQNSGGMSLDDFIAQAKALDRALERSDADASRSKYAAGGLAQLVGFGTHNGQLVAAISLGDLDTAANVTVNVPGATTTLKKNADIMVRSARDLLSTASGYNPNTSYAVVSWLGYDAPPLLDVPSGKRSVAGGVKLANFIDGIYDARPTPPSSFTVIAHSYGSPTAADALTRTRNKITSFVSIGSVGFNPGNAPENLNVKQVYAPMSANDDAGFLSNENAAGGTAQWGNTLAGGKRTDPLDFSEVTEISAAADPAAGTLAVTGHDMSPDPDKTPDKLGYLSANTTSQDQTARVVARGGLK